MKWCALTIRCDGQESPKKPCGRELILDNPDHKPTASLWFEAIELGWYISMEGGSDLCPECHRGEAQRYDRLTLYDLPKPKGVKLGVQAKGPTRIRRKTSSG